MTDELRWDRRLLALLTFALHVATNLFSPYGVHRDEFLYLAMGRHLQLFKMEFPPAIAILAKISMLFGDSLVAIRIFPAIAAALLVYLAALIARELGGNRMSQLLAAIAVMASPLFLRAGNLFQPVVFDQLAWTLGLFALIKLGRTNDRKWWIWYGVAIGFGLLTKFSAIFFGAATFLALVVSPQRRWLKTPWPWIAMVLVFVIGSPSWIGQIRLDFPVVQQMNDLRADQLERVTPLEFIVGQVQLGPAFVLALAGLLWLLLSQDEGISHRRMDLPLCFPDSAGTQGKTVLPRPDLSRAVRGGRSRDRGDLADSELAPLSAGRPRCSRSPMDSFFFQSEFQFFRRSNGRLHDGDRRIGSESNQPR